MTAAGTGIADDAALLVGLVPLLVPPLGAPLRGPLGGADVMMMGALLAVSRPPFCCPFAVALAAARA